MLLIQNETPRPAQTAAAEAGCANDCYRPVFIASHRSPSSTKGRRFLKTRQKLIARDLEKRYPAVFESAVLITNVTREIGTNGHRRNSGGILLLVPCDIPFRVLPEGRYNNHIAPRKER